MAPLRAWCCCLEVLSGRGRPFASEVRLVVVREASELLLQLGKEEREGEMYTQMIYIYVY